eukprot:CAMPEP_0182495640 /NCGR_PEP_ID=MMETSP1321-20130603/4407_1 /TAXON_ID=91990 /ORGANISM="Bolidomonas sp., Strain RCC1657" /LENGTH=59 /DNA_ID=CAMNT_0024699069 /DNA_START=8 /DNA_END=187 /DNA_ORIENTATION=-
MKAMEVLVEGGVLEDRAVNLLGGAAGWRIMSDPEKALKARKVLVDGGVSVKRVELQGRK